MPNRASLVDRFFARYPQRRLSLFGFAEVAEGVVSAALQPLNLEIHQLSARAKDTSSAIAKVRRKGYGNPARQLTDLVGVRVILYYAEQVDQAVAAIARALPIDHRRSVDKRGELQVRQFGYRSVHLIARLPDAISLRMPSDHRRLWFEIQVRSVLEHAWAEIEHEICYKSGTRFPDLLLRRFGALAGALEILDTQFSALRKERDALIGSLWERYQQGQGFDEPLDTARLVALLSVLHPQAPGWRSLANGAHRFQQGTAAASADALKLAGLRTARQFRRVFESSKCRRLLSGFAGLHGIAPDELSHLAVAVLVVAARRAAVLRRFPDLLDDSVLASFVDPKGKLAGAWT